jgi:adenosylcobinamide-GDP ribazoletransferase
MNKALMARRILDGLTDFGLAWRLLTAVPLPFIPQNSNRQAGKAAGYYPCVGIVIGLVLAVTGWFFFFLFPSGVASALVLVVWVGLTGMLHLDGFMDTCDGLLPPRNRARRLEIMKDSRVGAFGVVGGVLLLLLKFNGLATLLDSSRWAILIVVPTLARWAMAWAMIRYPLARNEGLAVLFMAGLGRRQVVLASVLAAGTAFVLLGISGIVLLVVAWLVTTLMARFAVARIGGLTGDIYGATCEVTETILLITALPTVSYLTSVPLSSF